MTGDEESPKSPEGEAPAKRPRSRRGRRGGRGRGRARKPIAPAGEAVAEPHEAREMEEPSVPDEMGQSPVEPPLEEMPLADSAIEEARREAAEADVADADAAPEFQERYEEPRPSERRDFRPASPPAVADAIVEVTHIIADLKRVLDDMEEVLEILELAEVQKNVDEREIQSLRQALRQLDRRGSEPRREPPGERSPQPYSREPRRDRRR